MSEEDDLQRARKKYRELIKREQRRRTGRSSTYDSNIAPALKASRQLVAIDKKIKELRKDKDAGRIDEDEYEQKLKELEDKKDKAEEAFETAERRGSRRYLSEKPESSGSIFFIILVIVTLIILGIIFLPKIFAGG